MQLEIVMQEVHKWIFRISEDHKNTVRVEIVSDKEDSFIVDFETDKFIAQLTVNDTGFQPYRFVEFIALDKGRDLNQPYAYLYHDNEESRAEEIIKNLDDELSFILNSRL
ncbi:MAG: hypothetical protein J1F11_04115 [Oscillospiraceae bacterium]|nr:hypothetical protein [Oscillospiraceae bacterium]